MQTRKIDDIKKLYLENCIRENNYPHQEIISKLRLAEAGRFEISLNDD